MNGVHMWRTGMATISGVTYMTDKKTFTEAIKILHTAMYGITRPDDDVEFQTIKDLIDGYLFLLSDMDMTFGRKIQEFILTHPTLKDEDIEDLFLVLAATPTEYES